MECKRDCKEGYIANAPQGLCQICQNLFTGEKEVRPGKKEGKWYYYHGLAALGREDNWKCQFCRLVRKGLNSYSALVVFYVSLSISPPQIPKSRWKPIT
jgi:hypothetical protein